MQYGDQNGQDWADIIDFLTMHPHARRKVVRLGPERSRLPTNLGGRARRATGEEACPSLASPRLALRARPAHLA